MHLRPSSAAMVLSLCLSVQPAGAQALDRNAQRIVNDATRDLKSRDAAKRADAVERLATWGKLSAAPLVIGALKDPDASVRAAAADALWDDDMKTDSARGPLTAAMDDPSPDVVVLAAGALRLLGASKADVQKANATTAPRTSVAAPGRTAASAAGPKPSAEDEARGLSAIRAPHRIPAGSILQGDW
jgi:hypothetical protein